MKVVLENDFLDLDLNNSKKLIEISKLQTGDSFFLKMYEQVMFATFIGKTNLGCNDHRFLLWKNGSVETLAINGEVKVLPAAQCTMIVTT